MISKVRVVLMKSLIGSLVFVSVVCTEVVIRISKIFQLQ